MSMRTSTCCRISNCVTRATRAGGSPVRAASPSASGGVRPAAPYAVRQGCLRRGLFDGERHAAAFEREALAPADLALGVEQVEDGRGHLWMGAAKHAFAHLFARQAVGERLRVVMRRQRRRHRTRQRRRHVADNRRSPTRQTSGRAWSRSRASPPDAASARRRAPARSCTRHAPAPQRLRRRSAVPLPRPSAPSSGARSRRRRSRVASARTPSAWRRRVEHLATRDGDRRRVGAQHEAIAARDAQLATRDASARLPSRPARSIGATPSTERPDRRDARQDLRGALMESHPRAVPHGRRGGQHGDNDVDHRGRRQRPGRRQHLSAHQVGDLDASSG